MFKSMTLVLFVSAVLVAEEGPVLVIEGERLQGEQLALPLAGSIADLGTALREQPGVEGVRMGGHGVDPVMRGLQQERIDVSIDGARFFGGCPNRMDPPSAYIAADLIERIDIQLGVHSLLGAAPAPGGSIEARRAEIPQDGPVAQGSLRAASNGAGLGLAARGGYGSKGLGFELRASYDDADDYEDGHGDEVHSSYTTWATGLGVGGALASWEWRADIDWSAGRDLAYAGARMDAPETDLILGQAQARYEAAEGEVFKALTLRGSYGAVEHVMDNFSLRDVPVMAGMARYMRADSTTDTSTVEAEAELEVAARPARVSLSYLTVERWAERYSGNSSAVPMLQSVLWPEVESQRLGLAYEQDVIAEEGRRFVIGLRLDYCDRSAGTASKATSGGGSADSLYQMYYGHDASAAEDSLHVGFLLRWQQDIAEGLSYDLGFSRSLRPADGSEAFIAAANMNPGMRWVGDPGINDENHHQWDAGLQYGDEQHRFSAHLFYNIVDDFILRDTARGQDGILRSDGASIYRNVQASLLGGELRAAWTFLSDWEVAADLAYVHGDNDDDDRALAQMPPLGGRLSLSWDFQPDWQAKIAMPWAAEQNRIDQLSGQDVGETPAWATINLSCSARFAERWSAAVGIDNLFDKHYAMHLNKAGAFDPTVERVYEPGRAFWARVGASF